MHVTYITIMEIFTQFFEYQLRLGVVSLPLPAVPVCLNSGNDEGGVRLGRVIFVIPPLNLFYYSTYSNGRVVVTNRYIYGRPRLTYGTDSLVPRGPGYEANGTECIPRLSISIVLITITKR